MIFKNWRIFSKFLVIFRFLGLLASDVQIDAKIKLISFTTTEISVVVDENMSILDIEVLVKGVSINNVITSLYRN